MPTFNPNEDTIELKQRGTFADHFFAPDQSKFEVRLGAATHPGKVRSRNEDHYAVTRRTRTCEVLFTNLSQERLVFPQDLAYGMVVADGIGGSAFGDFASQLALRTMFELAGRATSWVMKLSDPDAQHLQERVAAYVDQIQKTFHQYSLLDPRMGDMGTTWTSAYVIPPHAVCVNIGDSRAYLYRDRKLRQITQDQTLAQELIDAGAAAKDVTRFRHLLTNSLGGSKEHVEAEVYYVELQPDDRLLLCTDGLTNMLDDATIGQVLQAVAEPPAACDRLIELALERGGKDNVTVLICDLAAAETVP